MELISIHALREEGDPDSACPTGFGNQFLSTPSARRATIAAAKDRIDILTISIHALREEGDRNSRRSSDADRSISIHALREEGDNPGLPQRLDVVEFLSTPSARRATSSASSSSTSVPIFLSTPSARRATGSGFAANGGDDISIHTLREESDKVSARVGFLHIDFYPRPP